MKKDLERGLFFNIFYKQNRKELIFAEKITINTYRKNYSALLALTAWSSILDSLAFLWETLLI